MASSRTPFRNLIFLLRVGAGIFGTAGLGLYIVVFKDVLNDWDSQEAGLTALPIAAGGIILIWSILSAIFMLIRMSHLFLTIGDFFIFIAATVLGVIGFYHDDETYLSTGNANTFSWDNDSSWLQIEEIGAVMLLVAVVHQLLLVLFNFLEYRHVKRAGRRVSLPPYIDYQPAAIEKKDDFELDWQSVVSEKTLPSVVKKPVSAVV
ncbi:uncharacterized protein LY89DRAFT_683069 [Mollisia scopiformis]|uniref:Uncharacterized protein n=1 Tax=Mollisia scopiformis TaxID=149040 RepID=A0A194XG68_MOLSC|nr:uncharacterized protein LY89DRAFT_683069 [Mollisia scopiformis]KUJ19136.1 hypothetical protein LY89DRAFT_683069 [Mollisia scopiformis]